MSQANLFLSIPQVLIVLFAIIRGKLKEAVIFHFLFLLTSLSATAGLNESLNVINYSRLKLVGGLGIHQVLSFIIVLLSYNKVQSRKLPFFDLCFKILFILALTATIFGIFGFAFSDYKFHYFLARIVYMSTLLMNMYILKKNVDVKFLKTAVRISFALLVVAPVVALVSFNCGITVKYSIFDVPVFPDVTYFVPLLLLSFFYVKQSVYSIISLTVFFILIIQVGRGGMFLISLLTFLVFVYQVFFMKEIRESSPYRWKAFRFMLIVVFILLIGGALSLNVEGLAVHKLQNLISLLSFATGSYSIDDVDNSPYVRIAEVLNILNENNPFFLCFGKGYGGYFLDNLDLLSKASLFDGGFADDVILSGKFPTAHSVYPNTLLYNGIIGLVLVIYLGIKSLKRISYSFFSFAGFILFFYALYFNHLMGSVAAFILFASELNLKEISYENTFYR